MEKRNVDLLIYRLLTLLELDTVKFITLNVNGVFIHTNRIKTDELKINFYWNDILMCSVFYRDLDSIEKF